MGKRFERLPKLCLAGGFSGVGGGVNLVEKWRFEIPPISGQEDARRLCDCLQKPLSGKERFRIAMKKE